MTTTRNRKLKLGVFGERPTLAERLGWKILRRENSRYLVGRIGKYTIEIGGTWKRKPLHGNEFFVNFRSKGEMTGLRTFAQVGGLFVEALAVEAPAGRYVQFGSAS